VVIEDIEQVLVSWPGQADVGSEDTEAARSVVAFAWGLNAHGRVRTNETR
jgi:hypothetical protein